MVCRAETGGVAGSDADIIGQTATGHFLLRFVSADVYFLYGRWVK